MTLTRDEALVPRPYTLNLKFLALTLNSKPLALDHGSKTRDS